MSATTIATSLPSETVVHEDEVSQIDAVDGKLATTEGPGQRLTKYNDAQKEFIDKKEVFDRTKLGNVIREYGAALKIIQDNSDMSEDEFQALLDDFGRYITLYNTVCDKYISDLGGGADTIAISLQYEKLSRETIDVLKEMHNELRMMYKDALRRLCMISTISFASLLTSHVVDVKVPVSVLGIIACLSAAVLAATAPTVYWECKAML